MSEIEYFYSAHSGFAYLGSARFIEIARAAGRRIVHKPVDLDPVIAAVGSAPFTERTPKQRTYYSGREIERWAVFRDIPVMKRLPSFHREPVRLVNGVLIAAMQQGHLVDDLAHGFLFAHWVDDANLADPETLAGLISAAGLEPAALLDAALSDAVMAIYDANTREAIERSVFGSPTYFVDGDMFYGQDHLEMLERALSQPFADTWQR